MASSLFDLLYSFFFFFFGCVQSLCGTQAFSSCGVGLACCSTCALEHSSSRIVVYVGLGAPQHVGS